MSTAGESFHFPSPEEVQRKIDLHYAKVVEEQLRKVAELLNNATAWPVYTPNLEKKTREEIRKHGYDIDSSMDGKQMRIRPKKILLAVA